MLSPRSALLLAVFSLMGSGCATQAPERRMVPEAAHSVQDELGYNDAVRLSQDYALARGYELSDAAQAEKVRPNYWRVRFGLAPKGSGRALDLYFDEAQHEVVGSTELNNTATGGSGPGRTPTP